ncbi:protein STRUBBELIG-RECEPTOR FAMILY 2 isoform X1 [Actinidia eriantha]|uniref:protein STRUBBELIG-RECEPTOR FAMILY 2 isoform X1 n=1 Tax=Actinidia eriantha TaxID=165200 RepID=UPI00258A0E3D|nr:protein STRUBBELIG-RECEPTOR FAMILY 2 isoform X1 [Actinidia eriantha]XP_057505841.1 protein STRUBBELIG-RECEPTOR FAMILY 2 isoform X1 [Actinidia eriantha]
MAKWRLWLYLAAIAFLAILVLEASAYTDDLDVMALQDMYAALNSPPQLQGWKLSGGDPCEESWAGVACSGSSIIHIKLNGLELTGKLGFRLSQLHSLKQLDVSSNNIQGEIPYGLPLNATHINLACNNFSANIPYNLTFMKYLRHLNLSHNSLSGPIGNVFDGLLNLKEMDLSYNNFSGDLPSCFGSLMSLNRLFLEKNGFTGSVILLARLPLSDLNIQDNHFSGVLPNQFQYIRNLWLEGNSLKAAENDPPWNFPLEVPAEQNISSPPTTEENAMESYPSHKVGKHKKNGLGPGGVACLVGGVTLMATCVALIIVIRIHRSRTQKRSRVEISSEFSQHSLPLSTAKDYFDAQESPRISNMGSPSVAAPKRIPPTQTRTDRMSRRSFSKKLKIPISAKVYTLAELQSATNGFSEQHLLGEGSLGSVYKADFPNGQVLAVKNINTVTLSLHEEEQFLDVIWNAARLRHPNIVTLLGYSFERGQHLLVYEYVRNLTLDDALHCEAYLPLSWGLRLKIALGVARALDYLHSTCSPPVAHSNLKAANILLDEELMPRLSDCGLTILRPLTSNSVKVKASEMAIGYTGYVAPECVQHGTDSIKGDIYAFGVLLLELLTGKKPFDGLRPREEKSLVKWASSRLHDNEYLEKMVDPSIKRSLSSRALSRFADIVSLCVQPEKEFRPPMSEIVESLTSLIHKVDTGRSPAADNNEGDPFDKSFRSTRTRFFGSPAMSY